MLKKNADLAEVGTPYQRVIRGLSEGNNTIPDGGVAPRHLLRLDGVTRKDLKGQKKM